MNSPESDLLDLVRRVRSKEPGAKEQLVSAIYGRLNQMTRRMLRNAPSAVVRWDQTGDVVHSAWFRIERTLEASSIEIRDEAHLFRLIAQHLRFQLIETYRKNVGVYGVDGNHGNVDEHRSSGCAAFATDLSEHTNDIARLVTWGEFHEQVEELPDREKAVVDLVWYQGLPIETVAQLLGMAPKAVQRAWRRAKIQLAQDLGDSLLG